MFFPFCRLYHFFDFDLSSCAAASGPVSPEFSRCIPVPGSNDCTDFIELECAAEGNILIETEVVYLTECQDFLFVIGEAIGADYFEFDSEAQTCKLLDSRSVTV